MLSSFLNHHQQISTLGQSFRFHRNTQRFIETHSCQGDYFRKCTRSRLHQTVVLLSSLHQQALSVAVKHSLRILRILFTILLSTLRIAQQNGAQGVDCDAFWPDPCLPSKPSTLQVLCGTTLKRPTAAQPRFIVVGDDLGKLYFFTSQGLSAAEYDTGMCIIFELPNNAHPTQIHTTFECRTPPHSFKSACHHL